MPAHPAAEQPPQPSDAVRAAISVALAVYLVGLALSILGNSGSGTSALVRTIKGRLFAPWLVPAWLDLGFDHHLTYGLPDDADHALEIGRHGPGPGGAAAPLRLPGPLRGERAARWRRLARSIAAGESDGGDAAVLATAVGSGAFDELASEDVMVRVLRTPLPERTAPAGPSEQAYAARVRRVGGDVQLIKAEARGEVAPVVRPRTVQP